MHKTTISAAFVLLVTMVMTPARAEAQKEVQACTSLTGHLLVDGTVALTEAVGAGEFTTPPGGRGGGRTLGEVPAFCRVVARLSPARGSEILVEVWLPAVGWNGKLLALGNGGFAGSIGYQGLGSAVADGYAAASTDTGHTGNDPAFALEREKLIDFAHRAIHEMTVAAKSVIAARYGASPQLSYFNGCSTGGRQALTAAQRYPADFDAVIAGAPANSTGRMTTQQLWTARAVLDDPAAAISEEGFASLHRGVLAACDASDGVADGVVENPVACSFDPGSVEALTMPQAAAAANIYGGAINRSTGRTIYPGLARGSELRWTDMAGGEPFAYARDIHRIVINQDPEWDFRTLDFDRDLATIDARINSVGMQAIDANLEPFFSRGGKLLMYHGWNDPLISPFNSVNYYKDATATTPTLAADSIRLFMMPGVNHCRGGAGTDTWDQVAVLDVWRTSGEAPDRVDASHLTDGAVDKTRPLCAYPQVAVYLGEGATNAAANFECRLR